MTATDLGTRRGESLGGPGPVAVIACVCELTGWCGLCRGDADRYLDAGYREVIRDGPTGVVSEFWEGTQ